MTVDKLFNERICYYIAAFCESNPNASEDEIYSSIGLATVFLAPNYRDLVNVIRRGMLKSIERYKAKTELEEPEND